MFAYMPDFRIKFCIFWFKLHSANCDRISITAERYSFNSLRPRLNRRPFADDIFKRIFLNENEWVLPRISLKFVPKVRINNIPALVQIMAWRRPGDKPLSGPMMVSLLTHLCVTRPQWVKAYFWLYLDISDYVSLCDTGRANIIFYVVTCWFI